MNGRDICKILINHEKKMPEEFMISICGKRKITKGCWVRLSKLFLTTVAVIYIFEIQNGKTFTSSSELWPPNTKEFSQNRVKRSSLVVSDLRSEAKGSRFDSGC